MDSPLTHFDQRSGLHGIVVDMVRHNGTLYAASTEGLFRLIPGRAGGNAHFKQLVQLPGQNWDLMSFDQQLLVANNDGVFVVNDNGTAVSLLDSSVHPEGRTGARALLRSKLQPSRVFVAFRNGLGSIRWSGTRWIDEGQIEAVEREPSSLAQDSRGRIWMGLWMGGMTRVSLPAGWQGAAKDERTVTLDHFDTDAGLPGGQETVYAINGKPRFLTHDGIYHYNKNAAQFEPDPEFRELFPGGPRDVDAIYQDRRGMLWMYTTSQRDIKESGRARLVDGQWEWKVTPLQRIDGIDVSTFYTDADGVAWIGGVKGIFRFDSTHTPAQASQFEVLLRQVTTHGGHVLRNDKPIPAIPYDDNALRFEFAAPSYDDFFANRFQVLLEGVDREWSPWNRAAYRDYTSIPPGDYDFRVRARNVYGVTGAEASFEFRVLPPWYQTPWAWTLWIVSGLALVGLLMRWRSAMLQQRNRELTALVQLRTNELAEVNVALQETNEALTEQIVTDPLTGLKNRRYLYDHIEQDLAITRRHYLERQRSDGKPSVDSIVLFLMVDIDHFKEINDTYGHAAGDRVLQQFRDILLTVIRDADIPVRWGGEEFLIVARGVPPEAGPQFSERIRTAVAAHRFDLGEERFTWRRTCSIGFACYPPSVSHPDELNWDQVVDLADECLYAAKHHGRNAWSGVMPAMTAPAEEMIDALRKTLARVPEPGPVRVITSWA